MSYDLQAVGAKMDEIAHRAARWTPSARALALQLYRCDVADGHEYAGHVPAILLHACAARAATQGMLADAGITAQAVTDIVPLRRQMHVQDIKERLLDQRAARRGRTAVPGGARLARRTRRGHASNERGARAQT